MHPQTLRKYERLGLVQPSRTIGSMRALLARRAGAPQSRSSGSSTTAGINLAGVQRLLSIAEVVQRIRPLMRRRCAVGARRAAPRAGARRADSDARIRLTWISRTTTPPSASRKTATEKEIKQAFRKLARKHHPDVNPGDKRAEARVQGNQRGARGPERSGEAQEVRRARRELAGVRAGRRWSGLRAVRGTSLRRRRPGWRLPHHDRRRDARACSATPTRSRTSSRPSSAAAEGR